MSSKLTPDTKSQIHKPHRRPSRINAKQNKQTNKNQLYLSLPFLKLQKTKNKLLKKLQGEKGLTNRVAMIRITSDFSEITQQEGSEIKYLKS